MWKYMSLLATLSLLAACSSGQYFGSNTYAIGAYDARGKLLSKRTDITSNKAGISTARDTLCKVYPRALIRVTNQRTGEEIAEYSPYRCR